MHETTYIAGNGNGNKLNRRIEMLENLLQAADGDGGASARTNSLRQALRRNKSDMADDTAKSLDVLRQVFQSDFTDEIKQMIDRHLRTTFTPAFENLRRNGHEVTDADISRLCVAILDGAKSAFLAQPGADETAEEGGGPSKRRKCVPAFTALLKPLNSTTVQQQQQQQVSVAEVQGELTLKLYESDGNESDAASLASYNSSIFNAPTGHSADGRQLKRRGRPKKADMMDTGRSGTPVMNGRQPVSAADALKWNPARFNMDTRFILSSKVNRLLGFSARGVGHLFNVHARAFRYVADDEDRVWLFQRGLTKCASAGSGKLFVMALEDSMEIAEQEGIDMQVRAELQRYAFPAPERMILKMKAQMVGPFEQLRVRVLPAATSGDSDVIGGAQQLMHAQQQQHVAQQQQQQAPAPVAHNFLPAFQL